MAKKKPDPETAAPTDTKESPKKKATLADHARDLAYVFVFAVLFLSARSSFADHYYVPSSSMRPTVEIGDRIVVDKLAFGLHIPFTRPYLVPFDGPHRGDVVVLDSPVDEITLLKRVVALPGDEIEVREGRIKINGVATAVNGDDGELKEQLGEKLHSIRVTHGGGADLGPTKVPEGQYLVVGDNRGESHDGRYFGFVERDRIRGRAIAIYWSNSRPVWRRL